LKYIFVGTWKMVNELKNVVFVFFLGCSSTTFLLSLQIHLNLKTLQTHLCVKLVLPVHVIQATDTITQQLTSFLAHIACPCWTGSTAESSHTSGPCRLLHCPGDWS
jgi:hypothetical protein